MRILGRFIVAGLLIFVLLQLVRPSIPAKRATAELQAPVEVRQILRKDCYSCHSDERRLSWFDEIVPGYWLVRHDILTAREHLNFSTLGARAAAAQKATLYEAVNMVQLGAMPLPQYLKLHPEARMSPADLATLKAYLAPWTPAPTAPAVDAQLPVAPTATPVDMATIRPEFNGLPFDPTFENWKLLSITDRGDNNTFRFILGNDVAFHAAQAGNVSPWPDNARFAKIAWQQQPGRDGLIYPGKFIQVELMVKHARYYKDSEGWGWGRWRGLDLKPYGKDAHFVTECTTCHLPVRGNDYVYTMPVSAAKVSGNEVLNAAAAAIPANLPYQPLGHSAVTMYVDPQNHSMAILYGNEAAMQAAQAHKTAPVGNPAYHTGSVLALVTWKQREDPHWFGARIPDRPQSVEFVQLTGSGAKPAYHRFAGESLVESDGDAGSVTQRTSFVLGLAPVQLP